MLFWGVCVYGRCFSSWVDVATHHVAVHLIVGYTPRNYYHFFFFLGMIAEKVTLIMAPFDAYV